MPLRDLQKKDLSNEAPLRGVSTKSDEKKSKMEQDGMDILYQAEITRYLERKETLDQNMCKAYTLIFSSYCNKAMQNRIKKHPDFESKIWDDLIKLLVNQDIDV